MTRNASFVEGAAQAPRQLSSLRQSRARFTFAGAALASAALLSACAVGPNYRRPVVQTPTTFRGADPATSGAAADPQALADLGWASLFNDETLTTLVRTALKQNFDLRIAAERVLQARAQLRITRSDQFPSIDASAGSVTLRLPATNFNAPMKQAE